MVPRKTSDEFVGANGALNKESRMGPEVFIKLTQTTHFKNNLTYLQISNEITNVWMKEIALM